MSQDVARHGIGGSDAAAACGLHPYRPPIALWLEITGRADPVPMNEPMEWGIHLEPAIRAKYATRNGVDVVVPPASVFHPDHDWARATPDGMQFEVGIKDRREAWTRHVLEIKNVGHFMASKWGDWGTDEIPPDYVIQGEWYGWILTALGWPVDAVDYAVLIGGQQYRELLYMRDAELGAMVVEGASRFWHNYVVPDVPPPVDGTEEYQRFIERRFPWSRDVFLQRTAEADSLASRLRDIYGAIADLTDEREVIKNKMKAIIGDASGIETIAGDIRWKQGKSTRPFNTPRDWPRPKRKS